MTNRERFNNQIRTKLLDALESIENMTNEELVNAAGNGYEIRIQIGYELMGLYQQKTGSHKVKSAETLENWLDQ